MLDSASLATYEAVPSQQRACELRTRMNDMCKSDLIRYAGAARKVFPQITEAAIDAAESIDTAAKLNPLLYSIQWKLSTALRDKNAGDVGSMLGLLAGLKAGRQLSAAPFAVENLSWDLVDVGIIDYLTGKEGPRTAEGGPPEITRMKDDEFAHYKSLAVEAIAAIAAADDEFHGEFESVVSGLRLFSGRGARGVSSPRAWGKILLRKPDPGPEADNPVLYYIDHITHETSHIILYAIMSCDPLITNGFTARYSAPIRPDPRPLYGIYHATFVLSRIAWVLSRYAKTAGSAQVDELLETTIERYRQGQEALSSHAELTNAGEHLLRSCEKMIAACV